MAQAPKREPLKARFVQHIGTIAYLRVYWSAHTQCMEKWPTHEGRVAVAHSHKRGDDKVGGSILDYSNDPRWPTQCDRCGLPVPKDATPITQHVFRTAWYDSPNGILQPGDLFYRECSMRHGDPCDSGWTNCNGRHLVAIVPSGQYWDIDSRANNCTMPKDTTHRCWIRHGEPPLVHVDKQGHTCQAGSGSIIARGYHGFLHHGVFSIG